MLKMGQINENKNTYNIDICMKKGENPTYM
jgi:hypothetical protein